MGGMRRSHGLRPEEPRPLSTLAEVCFQVDRKNQAIAAIRKAMRLDAGGSNVAPFLRRQLLRFEKGDKNAPLE